MTKDEEIRMINEKLDFLCNGGNPMYAIAFAVNKDQEIK